MGKKPIVSVTYENERISIKNSLRYLKCVSCQLTLLKMWACIRHVSVSADTLKRIPYTRVSVRFTLAETLTAVMFPQLLNSEDTQLSVELPEQ